MNKIEKAISDTELRLDCLYKDQLVIRAQINTLEEQLKMLKIVKENKSIPHDDTMVKLVQNYTEQTLPKVNQ